MECTILLISTINTDKLKELQGEICTTENGIKYLKITQ